MTKCLTCHGTLKKGETTCYLCGTDVPRDPNKVTFQQRFSKLVTVALAISSVMTVAALFTSWVPSFVKCLVATLVLFLVKSSAQQMWENR